MERCLSVAEKRAMSDNRQECVILISGVGSACVSLPEFPWGSRWGGGDVAPPGVEGSHKDLRAQVMIMN